ncbi:MAG: hypothetical protein ACLQBD_23835 [Syntrophobacteraceae bacterium]
MVAWNKERGSAKQTAHSRFLHPAPVFLLHASAPGMSYLVKKEENAMNVSPEMLDSRLRKMYPEIVKHDLSLSLTFDPGKDAWIIKLVKGKHELTTHLEKKDAEACLEGIQCIYLGVQISQFIENFESGE